MNAKKNSGQSLSVDAEDLLEILQEVKLGSPAHQALQAHSKIVKSTQESWVTRKLKGIFHEMGWVATGTACGGFVGKATEILGVKISLLQSAASNMNTYYTLQGLKSQYLDQPYYLAMANLTKMLGYAVPDPVAIGVVSIISILGMGALSATRSLTPAALIVGSYFLLGQTGVTTVPTAIALGFGGAIGHYGNALRHPVAKTGQILLSMKDVAKAMTKPGVAIQEWQARQQVQRELYGHQKRLGLA